MVTIGATTLLVMEINEVEPGIRELRCTSSVRPWRRDDELLSVYSHVLPEGPPAAAVYRSLEEARSNLKVIPLPAPPRAAADQPRDHRQRIG
jgi:hypothetical protein